MSDKRVTFKASYPAIQSAIKVDGQGGARIQLDIPESELMNFLPAMAWRGEALQVTIELDDEIEQTPELEYRGRLK